MPAPTIDRDRCNNCGKCLEICPMGVYQKEEEEVVVKNPEKCLGCRACEVQCPNEAIKVSD